MESSWLERSFRGDGKGSVLRERYIDNDNESEVRSDYFLNIILKVWRRRARAAREGNVGI